MTPAVLVADEAVCEALARIARQPDETAAVLLVGAAGDRLVARRLVESPDSGYEERRNNGLVLNPSAWAPALAEAEKACASALFVHTHPGGVPRPSERDGFVDGQLAEPFRIRSGSDAYGSVVLSPSDDEPGFTFTGHTLAADGSPAPLRSLLVVGRRIRLVPAWDAPEPAGAPERFDRQVRAFGGAVQHVLGRLRVGVAGAGGTGSAVLEQLVRLGVKDLTVVDPDVIALTNVTRVYGSTPKDEGVAKVDVQERHLRAIEPGLSVRAVRARTTDRAAAVALSGCDVVFGCTDDEAGRIVLSRLASYCLVPVFDCGVLLSSHGGVLEGIDGRITTMIPGQACLVCRGRVDLARARAESLADDELLRQQREGYAPELGGQEPAVVAYTTVVAALAVGELIERLTGHGPNTAPSEIIARLHEREISTNSRAPNPGHFCDPSAGRLGTGTRWPLLDWTWPEDGT